MADKTKIMNRGVAAVLLVAVFAALIGCDERTGDVRRRPARTAASTVVRHRAVVETSAEPKRIDKIPPKPVAPPSTEEAASTLADAQATLGETMKALSEILDASQRMQRELLDAPQHFSAPEQLGQDVNDKE